MLNSIKGFFSKRVKCWRRLCEVAGMFSVVGKVGGTLLYSRHTLLSLQILLLYHEQRVMQLFIFYKLITVLITL